MLPTTLEFLACPAGSGRCLGNLQVESACEVERLAEGDEDLRAGHLACRNCGARYPILNGVAILVPDVPAYLTEHARALRPLAKQGAIPEEYHSALARGTAGSEDEAAEWDLETSRVTAWYLIGHFLQSTAPSYWWRPGGAAGSQFLEELILRFWHQGPLRVLEEFLQRREPGGKFLDLGCSVGGGVDLARQYCDVAMGLDSSFTAILTARQVALGPAEGVVAEIPDDRLNGPRSWRVRRRAQVAGTRKIDFVVADVTTPPVKRGTWDIAASLNLLDMVPDPVAFPAIHGSLLVNGGTALHACPYVWPATVARQLRSQIPASMRDSAEAVEWLYRRTGFEIEQRHPDVPWLFFKNPRQVEAYSVHCFVASVQADGNIQSTPH
jgi:SAM-dependent methyltransferase/uncharacterized protein YbaR (Trm112 family)